jgi:hypothetical protein
MVEKIFNPLAKVKQGDNNGSVELSVKQPTVNIDFSKHAPRKYESEKALGEINYPKTKKKQYVQPQLFAKADEKDY